MPDVALTIAGRTFILKPEQYVLKVNPKTEQLCSCLPALPHPLTLARSSLSLLDRVRGLVPVHQRFYGPGCPSGSIVDLG